MPQRSSRRTAFPRITLDVIRYAYDHLATGSPYFIREQGRDAIKGCMLRVHRRSVEIGARLDNGTRWHRVALVDAHMSIEDVEANRQEVRHILRSLEDEEEEPSLRVGRRMTVQELWNQYRVDYVRKKSAKRSPRTLEFYDYLWNVHILPLIGTERLREVSISKAEALADEVTTRVKTSREWAEGRHTANHCLAQGRMVFEYGRRKGLILKNPFLEVDPYDVVSAQTFLRDIDLRAVGQALRDLEARASQASPLSRHASSRTALSALRVVLYTGCRHRAEFLEGTLSWFKEDLGMPRLEVPRAKGDRGENQGRFIYFGPHAVQLLKAIDRPPGVTHLVPGRILGRPLYRLNETWDAVLREARALLRDWQASSPTPLDSAVLSARTSPHEPGERIPVKALRHTAKTCHPRAGIAPEHSAQLLGHEAASLGERVYLHRHGPTLIEAAATYEAFVRQLLGDFEPSAFQ